MIKPQNFDAKKKYPVFMYVYGGPGSQTVADTWDGSMPESAVLGNEITLPTPVTVDANNNSASVATYTTVEVKYHGDEEVDPEYLQDYKFTPMHIAKSGSYYEITYKIYTLEQLDLTAHATLEAALEAAEDKALKLWNLCFAFFEQF